MTPAERIAELRGILERGLVLPVAVSDEVAGLLMDLPKLLDIAVAAEALVDALDESGVLVDVVNNTEDGDRINALCEDFDASLQRLGEGA